ncbi:MAG: nuclear transport factor 2 family protein [Acidobacteriota bacterium]|nr:nuclear transport factor 2 family protein [Acidobacteriota bacterium]
MTIKTILAVLGLFLTLSHCYAQNQGIKSELVIKKLERELEAALSKGDYAALDRILADDYIQITAQGDVKKKAEIVAVARSMSAGPRGISLGPEKTVDELTVRLHGDCALVAGRTTIRYQFMEYQRSSSQTPSQNPVTIDQERFIRSYSKVDGRWRLVAWQTTSIAKR